ncbi:thiamine diphosphokinase [Exiguobacterium sp. B2(2022)]|uniref:thiamine diphosphokinase n=1 Tax=Exiguobacterium sp. B2(2022) TaxID=2992755 RepID=UPI00237AA83F|nr:thiamine diphosphokinase [Exiguobacterium sp. B2(2022)]MDE0562033.1 thiamine diphosphokinase [Exiguobacterium sp. B2(2022)]
MNILIVAASPEPIPDLPRDADFVIGVDGGYQRLLDEGIMPDVVVGDFDSFKGSPPEEALRYPSEKDVTDLEIALAFARERGATRMDVYGGLGGRIDMTFANVGLLEAYPEMILHGEGQTVYLVRTGSEVIMKRDGHYLSFMPWKTATISIEGVKYPLDHHEVKSGEALTISNEWTEASARLTVHQGMVLVMIIKK